MIMKLPDLDHEKASKPEREITDKEAKQPTSSSIAKNQNSDKRSWSDFWALAEATKPWKPDGLSASKPAAMTDDKATTTQHLVVCNFLEATETDDKGNKKDINKPIPMRGVLERIFDRTDNWPRRVSNALFVPDKQAKEVCWLGSTAGLFGYLQSTVGIIEWRNVTGCVTKEEAFAELQRTAKHYDAVETIPHEPPVENHFYCGDSLTPGDGTSFRELISRFNPATEIDSHLIQAAFLTPMWGGPGGTRPCFVVTSDDGRGSGKSKLAEFVGLHYGGQVQLSQDEPVGKMKTRLLSPVALTKRVSILDNVKSMKFSWADLEAIITSPVISGDRKYVGESQRPNMLTHFITLNGPTFGKDISQRVIVVKISRPNYSGDWESDTKKFVIENQMAILADISAIMRKPPQALPTYSRWGEWEQAIVAKLPEPAEMVDVNGSHFQVQRCTGPLLKEHGVRTGEHERRYV